MFVIVSITKFSIVIGSPQADHVGVQLQVSDGTFRNWIPENGYPCDLHVSYTPFHGFLRNVSFTFKNLKKTATDVFARTKFS